MHRATRGSLPFVWVIAAGCGANAPETPPTVDVIAEAKVLLATYQEASMAGNGRALAALYHSEGAWWLGDGKKSFATPDSIAKFFAVDKPVGVGPAEWEFHDLSFEPIGSDAVVVAGRFHWRSKDGRSDTLSYSALLVRQGGSLKIRVEDESSGQP